MSKQRPVLVLTSFRNAGNFIQESAAWTLSQFYRNYRVVFTDDESTDDSFAQLQQSISSCSDTQCRDVIVRCNRKRMGMTANTHSAIVKYASPDDLIVIVDGDDRLLHRDVLTYINAFFERHDCWVMYGGSYWNPPTPHAFKTRDYDGQQLQHLRVSSETHDAELQDKWRVHHLRVFVAGLYLELVAQDPNLEFLRDSDGVFFDMAADVAVMRPIMEMAGPGRVKHNPTNIYEYNLHDENDHVIDHRRQWKCMREVFEKPSQNICSVSETSISPIRLIAANESGNVQRLIEATNETPTRDVWRLEATKDNCFFFENTLDINRVFHCTAHVDRFSPPHQNGVDFCVHVDEQLIAFAPGVRSSERPRNIVATIPANSTAKLSIVTESGKPSNGIWGRPSISAASGRQRFFDVLNRAEIVLPSHIPTVTRCIATVASPDHAGYLQHLLESIQANANCSDAAVCVMAVDDDGTIKSLLQRYDAYAVDVRATLQADATLKSVLYSIASVIFADSYICLDTDIIVEGNLAQIFETIESLEDGSTLAVRESNRNRFTDLRHAFTEVYYGRYEDYDKLIADVGPLKTDQIIINDGFFAGDRKAMLMNDSLLRESSVIRRWVFEKQEVLWRNQFAFNLALAKFGSAVLVDDRFNLQLNYVPLSEEELARSEWKGRRISIMHYNGNSRDRHPIHCLKN